MNAKQVINGMKRFLQIKLETSKLDDGVTTIEADSFEAGNDVFIVMDEERVPLQPGAYTLENGSTLLVETEGIIAEVSNGEPEGEPEAKPEKETEMTDDGKPKMIVESKVKETYFNKDMKKTILEENTQPDAEAVVESVEAVQEEILGETAKIISELTPDEVTEADASEMAVAVVEAVKETIEQMPEEVAMSFMKKTKKYGKHKLEEAEAEVVAQAEAEIVDAVAEVVVAETPEEVTPEVAKEIAIVVAEIVQEMVADVPEELKAHLFKMQKKVVSNLSKKNTDRVALAKEKISKLSKNKRTKKEFGKKPATNKIKHNPHRTVEKETVKMASNKQPGAMDRVMQKMFSK